MHTAKASARQTMQVKCIVCKIVLSSVAPASVAILLKLRGTGGVNYDVIVHYLKSMD